MRAAFSAAILFSLFASVHGWAAREARIRIESGAVDPRHHPPFEVVLSRDEQGILCRAPGAPFHHIEVRGLVGLAPPPSLRARPDSAGCARTLTWVEEGPKGRRARVCYFSGADRLIEDVLRWCTSI